jgi:hypothetical protein
MKTPKYLYPLRRVVDRTSVEIAHTGVFAPRLVLACGRARPYPQDMFGTYYPDAMRCPECWDALTDADRIERIERSAASRRKRQEREWRAWRAALADKRQKA